MNFKNKIKFYRKHNKLTQKNLANKLNVSSKAVSRWETGKNYPDIETLIKIAKLFNTSVDDLLNNKDVEFYNNAVNGGHKLSIIKKFLLYLNVLLIVLGYLELIQPYGIHISMIPLFLFVFSIVSLYLTYNNRKSIFNDKHKIIVIFSIILVINTLIGTLGVDVKNLMLINDKFYVQGFIFGRIMLIINVSLLFAAEISIIRNKN
ncbi:hypothetical protein WR164_01550 [Philodulcilactobacillus myokoensis]|uniref:HTH cro/C1-type domain-containing protein n=1 Tax=Philodulcilactobacillus myokoensis TaxID=2929573 RepID=A0A9W6EQR2_9LACO|nr:helix-turn-helix transcriptional regulator [Philodulcilactobacillus myokoensis]GLB46176.1 hypothetical protein WR164_01550 [Philodulcilactobacillus myokoensis]